MKKPEKIIFVNDLTAKINDAKSLVLVNLTGLKVSEQETLRRRLREAGSKMLVAKNTLLKRSLVASNLKELSDNIVSSLTGQTAIVIAQQDELAPIQVLGKFIKEFELLALKAGIISGTVQDAAALLKLSRLPGREVLFGQLLGVLNAPMYQLTGTLQANMSKLVYILSTKSEALNSKQS
ncbi:50S ribosomal protein L10 [Candidatus Microgenomates bacterium]|nr:50S ribosomal protein L10 [Candidatus Microgenomates bacterium]